MKLLPEFPGVDGSWQEPTGVDKEGSGQEMAGKGPDRRYPETVLEPLGSNSNSTSKPLAMLRHL